MLEDKEANGAYIKVIRMYELNKHAGRKSRERHKKKICHSPQVTRRDRESKVETTAKHEKERDKQIKESADTAQMD